MIIRDAEIAEIGPLAKIWHDGWQDAHARILPVELARLRTLESFRERLGAALASVRVAGDAGAPVGSDKINALLRLEDLGVIVGNIDRRTHRGFPDRLLPKREALP
jgi:hypothetical protein